ncbi:hypothetical protein Tco_0013450 [Tanacetum coccineum]
MALFDDDLSAEDQPLPADASPTTRSPGYITDSKPIKDDPEEDPEMDPVDYVANEEEESSKDEDKEEDEHLALADYALSIPDSVSSAEEMEPFETDESAATPLLRSPHTTVPLSMTRLRRAWKTFRPQTPLSSFIETQIVEYASAPTPPLPPPSPLTPLSSPLPLIPSLSLPLPSPDRRGAIPEADMPPRKRIYFTAPSHRFEIRESSAVATASIQATDERVMTALEEVNERMTDLVATHKYDSEEFYTRHHDAQDARALLQARISTLERKRRYFCSISEYYMLRFRDLERTRDVKRQDRPGDASSSLIFVASTALEDVKESVADMATRNRQDNREAMYARHAWTHFMDRIRKLQAVIRVLQDETRALQQHRRDDHDMWTRVIGRIQMLEISRDPKHPDRPRDAGSSC